MSSLLPYTIYYIGQTENCTPMRRKPVALSPPSRLCETDPVRSFHARLSTVKKVPRDILPLFPDVTPGRVHSGKQMTGRIIQLP